MPAVLVTGADGYLGTLVALRYLSDIDLRVLAGVRAADQDELDAKTARLSAILGDDQVTVVPLDVRKDDPFQGLSSVGVDQIIQVVHSAAITRFDVSEQDARAVNIEGSSKVWEFARKLPNLVAATHISTVYASGLHSGDIDERNYDDSAGFANLYEWSKWVAEENLPDDLPVRVCRVATAIADGTDGAVTQYNAFHQTLRLIFYGLLSVAPGNATVPLHFVTGEFAAKSIFDLAQNEAARGIFHVAHEAKSAVTVGGLLDIAYGEFSMADEFKAKRILPPLLTDRVAFEALSGGIAGIGGDMVSSALGSMSSFAPQLYVAKNLSNERLRSTIAYTPESIEEIVRNTCQRLVETRWGRRDRSRS